MLIGIPKEIKDNEFRMGATPAMVRLLVSAGHRVMVQQNAGTKIGYTDEMFRQAGAEIMSSAGEIYSAEMIIKVKEPQEAEFPLLKEGQILFCYLHLAPDPIQTKHLVERKVVAIAYETVTDPQGRLPLLIPMSEIAGRISIQVGAVCLQLNNGGKGMLLGGVPGCGPRFRCDHWRGTSGTEAARMAMGLGANVTILDRDINRLRTLDSVVWAQFENATLLPGYDRGDAGGGGSGGWRRADSGKNSSETDHAPNVEADEPGLRDYRHRH